MNILAGDIGGTKTLLAIYNIKNGVSKVYQEKYISFEWDSLESIISHFLKGLPDGINNPNIGCLALAGPVTNGSCSITNLGWEINKQTICKLASLNYLELINDVSALIYGIPFLNKTQYIQVQPGIDKNPKNDSIAVIAAGTGLGMAKGMYTQNSISAFPSEGGHREFAPRSEKEWVLAKWLKEDLNLQRLSIERIVSGNGLGHVARWRLSKADAISHPLRKVSETWRYKKDIHQDLPSLVSKAANSGDQLMQEVRNLWLGAYGSAAGDLALQELCGGGLWIAGGTTSKHLEGIRSATFLEPMRSKGRFYKYLVDLPVLALVDHEAGLFSAACRARMLAELSEKLI